MRPELLEKISNTISVTKLNLANMQIKSHEIEEIINVVHQQKPGISVIDLDNNLINDEGAQILSASLRKLSNVNKLSVQFNDIGTEGAISLFRLKIDRPKLEILFHGNQITDVGTMEEIEEQALQHNRLNP